MNLELRGVRCDLGRRRALREVSCALAPGEVLAVLGQNGAGKTTLLRVMSGLLRPNAGEVLWNGRPPAQSQRRRLAYVGHKSFLYDDLTAMENLLFYAELYGVADAPARARQLLAAEGLTLFSHEPVRSFSRGMQQRLALCRAWLTQPELALLDEPWTGLDRESTGRWEQRLAALRAAGGSAVVVLHDLEAAARVADRFLLLQNGRVAEQGAYALAGAGGR